MALGNSPAMMAKNVGIGSVLPLDVQRAAGSFLDGAQELKLRIPAMVPAKDFWSVSVYDSLSRSELQNGEKFPSVSNIPIRRLTPTDLGRLFRSDDAAGQERNGSRPSLARAGFRSSGSMGRLSRSATRVGCSTISRRRIEQATVKMSACGCRTTRDRWSRAGWDLSPTTRRHRYRSRLSRPECR